MKIWLFIRFRWHLLDHGDRDDDIYDMEYDAFISYSYHDLAWVRENIMNFLQSPELGYKVCLHQRYWPAGVLITENIRLSVKHSRCMIMVLSDDYLNSYWCRAEFQAAHTQIIEGRTKYLIIVSLPDVDFQKVRKKYPEIYSHVKTHTYLETENKWFREKLIYAMPEKPLGQMRAALMNTNDGLSLEEQERDRQRFPALFYRMFTYDDRGYYGDDPKIKVI